MKLKTIIVWTVITLLVLFVAINIPSGATHIANWLVAP